MSQEIEIATESNNGKADLLFDQAFAFVQEQELLFREEQELGGVKLPIIQENALKNIAYRALQSKHEQDSVWVRGEMKRWFDIHERKRSQSLEFGYAPFTNLDQFTHLWIQKNCGAWVLPKMAEAFQDPENIYPEWGVQCAKTMSLLGKETCQEAGELYHFVTTHLEWERQKMTRDRFKREWESDKRRRKFNSSRRRSATNKA